MAKNIWPFPQCLLSVEEHKVNTQGQLPLASSTVCLLENIELTVFQVPDI
jgi:hypothetical protein